jgi:membrane-associated phospholipid phosphatase
MHSQAVSGPAAGEMHTWQAATVIFFIYIGTTAAVVPRLRAARRSLAMAGSVAGVLVAVAAPTVSQPLLNDWIVPPLVLLVAYWTSGLLFVAPMPRAERTLLDIDRVLRVRRLSSSTPRVLAELLEVAYAAVYPIIPIALIIHVATSGAPDANRFWSVILITDYICFGMLPWVQTRTPRALETEPPWNARFRAINLKLLGKTSIHVNTFPSGHAAEALAAALLVLDAPAPIVIWMFLNALAISAGAVLGRYHYAADAILGWVVAVCVWLLVKG